VIRKKGLRLLGGLGGWGQGNRSLSEFWRERRKKDLLFSDLNGGESVQF
jgi:hypothetical protein